MNASESGSGNGRAFPDPLPALVQPVWDRCDMAGLVTSLKGRRLILINKDGQHHGFRATSDLEDDQGVPVVWVVREEPWSPVPRPRTHQEPLRWPATAAWVELEA